MAQQQVGLAHAALSVIDLARARRFYAEGVGLTEIERPDLGRPGAWFSVGTSQLHLAVVEELPTERDPAGHVAFSVPRDQLVATVENASAAGAEVLVEPTCREQFGKPVWSAILRDPDGNRLEITDAPAMAGEEVTA